LHVYLRKLYDGAKLLTDFPHPKFLRAQRRYQKCRKCEENDSKDEIARAAFTMEKPDEWFCS